MRPRVEQAFRAGLDAVDARAATREALRTRPPPRAVHVIGLGKAALGMCAGVLDACEVVDGLVVAPIGAPDLFVLPATVEVLRGAHPVPDADVGRRGEALLARAAAIPAEASVIVLVSGGGSALVDAPVDGVSVDELADMTRRLLASGAAIEEINAMRVAGSRSKGGGLARALAGRDVRTLVISDIVSGDPALVASGPMSAWPGPAPAEVARRPHVAAVLSAAEIARAEAWTAAAGLSGALEVVADNDMAVSAIRRALEEAGARVGTGPALAGEARVCGRAWAAAARDAKTDALVAGGETVVTVRGRGRGGRNHETALAALDAGICGTFLCAGTDGIDGPTRAAGGVIDDGVRAASAGRDLRAALDDNDAFTLLDACGGTLITGPTGTNVADVAIWARDGALSR